MFYEVILDSGEAANKCTIVPLMGRADFKVFKVRRDLPLGPLNAPFLLHHEGRCLTEVAKGHKSVEGIATVDCVWKRLNVLLKRIKGVLPQRVRIPDGFVTAYPRKSALDTDPEGGLATIEAIFTAAAILGHWDVTLFERYYFGRKYVELNAQRFVELGVHQASQETLFPPPPPPRQRDARQRRRDRRAI